MENQNKMKPSHQSYKSHNSHKSQFYKMKPSHQSYKSHNSHKSQFFLYTDGGARGNPGPGAAGVVIKKDSETVLEKSKYLGKATNNQAEYQALILGLEQIFSLVKSGIVCYLDSELIVRQLNGQYRVKDEKLKPLFEKVKKLTEKFESVEFRHITRERNKEADRLVNEELDRKY